MTLKVALASFAIVAWWVIFTIIILTVNGAN